MYYRTRGEKPHNNNLKQNKMTDLLIGLLVLSLMLRVNLFRIIFDSFISWLYEGVIDIKKEINKEKETNKETKTK